MGVTDTIAGGPRTVVEHPWVAALGVCVAYLLVDLVLKLVGVGVLVGGVQMLGGRLTVASLATLVLDGVIVGLAVGLAGIGLSMTYSILSFANFAHGDTVTVGGFVGWVAASMVAGVGTGRPFEALFLLEASQQLSVADTPLAVLAALAIAAAGTVVAVLAVDRVVYRPMRDADGISLLIASIGVALALRYLVAFVFGAAPKGVATNGARLTLALPGGSVNLTDNELALVAVAAGLMLGVHLLLQRTKLGTAMRAMADNEDLARITGIPTERVVRLTWAVGGALAGAAGFLLVLESGTISFNFGWILLLLIFAAVITGGIGSIYGAMAGGLAIGLVDTLSQVWLPSGLTRAGVFVVLIVILLVRPEGIFGGVSTA